MVEAEEEDEEDDTVPFFIDTVTSEPPLVHVYSMESKWMAQLTLGNLNVKLKLDTGADTNIISEETLKKLVPRPALKKSPITMRAYNSKLIPSLGVCQVTLKHKDRDMSAVFEVVPSNRQALLGSAGCERMGLVQRVDEARLSKPEEEFKEKIRQEHQMLWRGDAVLPGCHSFRLKDGACGVINAARCIAFAK